MTRSVVVVGSLNADLVVNVQALPKPGETVPGTSFAIYPGGKGANQACAAARLGAEVHMVGRVGDDDHGRLLVESLAAAGVHTSAVAVDAATTTGTALITVDAAGQNEIVVVPGANGTVSAEDVERNRALIESAGFVLLQLEIPVEAVAAAARIARQASAIVLLDPAPARAEALDLLPLVDYVTPNETELAVLVSWAAADSAADPVDARPLLKCGVRRVAAKLGADGVRFVADDGEHVCPGFAVEPVDTTAAGDVWNGSFAAGLATGLDVATAGRFANAAAAISVTRAGAQPSMPSRSEVDRLIAGGANEWIR